VPRDTTTLVFDFAYEGGGIGKGGTVTLRAGDQELGSGAVAQTQPGVFSADETADVGVDHATPVDPNYGDASRNAFRGGTIQSVTVEVH